MVWMIPAVLFLGLLAGAHRSAQSPSVVATPACEPPATELVRPVPWVDGYDPFTAVERNLATQLVAIFENRETTLQYAYTEHHDDGRGFTVGAVGFTTGTGDALEVIRTYRRLAERAGEPGRAERVSGLTRYMPALERIDVLSLDDPARAEVGELGGFDGAWSMAASDPLFVAAQDSVMEGMYYVPALRLAKGAGLSSAFARAAFLDVIIQHGGGDDADGLPAIVVATASARGIPANEREEREWLRHFLGVRRAVLECAHTDATREMWRESVTRVDVYDQLLESGNLAMTPPLRFQLDGRGWELRPN